MGVPPEGPERVGKPSHRAGRGQEALPKSRSWLESRERLGIPPEGLGGVGRGTEALLEVWEGSGVLP